MDWCWAKVDCTDDEILDWSIFMEELNEEGDMILAHFDWCFFNNFASLLADYVNVSKNLNRLKHPKVRNIYYFHPI